MSSFSDKNVIVVNCNCFEHLYTKIRDQNTQPIEWRKAAQRIMNVRNINILCLYFTFIDKNNIYATDRYYVKKG